MPRGGPCADRDGLVKALGLFAGATLLTLFGIAALGGGPLPTDDARLRAGGAKGAAGALAACLLRPRAGGPAPAPAAPAAIRRAAPAGILSGIAFLPVATATVLLQQWILSLSGRGMRAQALVTEGIGGPWTSFLLVAAIAVIVAPLFEEVLFRGFLYSGLRAFLGPALSALLSAGLFAVIHGEPDAYPVTFLLGLCLADLRGRTGGLSAPIAMHACYNAWQVGGMLLLRLSGTTGGG